MSDEFDFDDDFLFDDDMDTSKPNTPPGKVSRVRSIYNTNKSILKKIGKGILSGFKSGLEESFPNTASLVEEVVSIRDDISSLKDDVMKEIEPTLQTMSTIGARVLPQAENFIPDKIYNKLLTYLKEHGEDEDALSDDARLKRERESTVSDAVANAFATKMEQDVAMAADDKKEQQVDRLVNAERHSELASMLTSVDSRLASISTFIAEPMTNYFKASLELKYRHLFVTTDIFNNLKDTSTKSVNLLTEIKHNVGLPDSVKADELKQKKGKIREYIGSRVGDLKSKFFKNLKEDLLSNFEMVTSLVPMLDMATSMMDTMGGSKKLTTSDVIGSLGGFLTSMVVKSKVTDYFDKGKAKDVKTLMEYRTDDGKERFNLGLMHLARDWSLEGGWKGFLGDTILSGLTSMSDSKMENPLFADPTAGATFDNITKEAIIAVIPRHLQHIGSHVERLSTKFASEISLIDRRFDHESGTLKTGDEVLKNIAMKAREYAGYSEYDRSGTIDKFKIAYAHTQREKLDDVETMFNKHHKDINKFITNIATQLEGQWRPEEFKNYTPGGSISNYISKAIQRLEHPEEVLFLIKRAIFSNKGHLNMVANEAIERAILREVKNTNPKAIAEFFDKYNMRGLAIEKGLYSQKDERITAPALHAMFTAAAPTDDTTTYDIYDKSGKVIGKEKATSSSTNRLQYEYDQMDEVQKSVHVMKKELKRLNKQGKGKSMRAKAIRALIGDITLATAAESAVESVGSKFEELKFKATSGISNWFSNKSIFTDEERAEMDAESEKIKEAAKDVKEKSSSFLGRMWKKMTTKKEDKETTDTPEEKKEGFFKRMFGKKKEEPKSEPESEFKSEPTAADKIAEKDKPSLTKSLLTKVGGKASKARILVITRKSTTNTELLIDEPISSTSTTYKKVTINVTHLPIFSNAELLSTLKNDYCKSRENSNPLYKRFYSKDSKRNFFPVEISDNVKILTHDKITKSKDEDFEFFQESKEETDSPSSSFFSKFNPFKKSDKDDTDFTTLPVNMVSPKKLKTEIEVNLNKSVIEKLATVSGNDNKWLKDPVENIALYTEDINVVLNKLHQGFKDNEYGVATRDTPDKGGATFRDEFMEYHLDFLEYSALQISLMRDLLAKNFGFWSILGKDPITRFVKKIGTTLGKTVKGGFKLGAKGVTHTVSAIKRTGSYMLDTVPKISKVVKTILPTKETLKNVIGKTGTVVKGAAKASWAATKTAGIVAGKGIAKTYDITKDILAGKVGLDALAGAGIGMLMGGPMGAVIGGISGKILGQEAERIGQLFGKAKRGIKGMFRRYIDVYQKDRVEPGDPILSAKKQKEGVFNKEGKRLRNSWSITEPLFELKEDGTVNEDVTVITKEQIEIGLVDINNEPLSKDVVKKDKKPIEYVRSGSTILDSLALLYKGMFGLIFGAAKTAGKFTKTVIGRLFGIEGAEIKEHHRTVEDLLSKIQVDLLDIKKYLLPHELDMDEDGDIDGSTQDQLQKIDEARKRRDSRLGATNVKSKGGGGGTLDKLTSVIEAGKETSDAGGGLVETGKSMLGTMLGVTSGTGLAALLAKVGKAGALLSSVAIPVTIITAGVLGSYFGYRISKDIAEAPDVSMSDEEISSFRTRMQEYIASGDTGIQSTLDRFNLYVSKRDWTNARELSNMNYNRNSKEVIKSTFNTLQNLPYSSRIIRHDSELDSDIGEELSFLLNEIQKSLDNTMNIVKLQKLRALKEHIYNTSSPRMSRKALEWFKREFKDIESKADVSDDAFEKYKKLMMEQNPLIIRRNRLIDSVQISMDNIIKNRGTSTLQLGYYLDDLDVLRKRIYNMPLDKITKEDLDSFDKQHSEIVKNPIRSINDNSIGVEVRASRMKNLRKEINNYVKEHGTTYGHGVIRRLLGDLSVSPLEVDDYYVDNIESTLKTFKDMANKQPEYFKELKRIEDHYEKIEPWNSKNNQELNKEAVESGGTITPDVQPKASISEPESSKSNIQKLANHEEIVMTPDLRVMVRDKRTKQLIRPYHIQVDEYDEYSTSNYGVKAESKIEALGDNLSSIHKVETTQVAQLGTIISKLDNLISVMGQFVVSTDSKIVNATAKVAQATANDLAAIDRKIPQSEETEVTGSALPIDKRSSGLI